VKCHQKYAMDNLYSPTITASDEIVAIDADMQRHMSALRLREGEHVRVLNGKGLVVTCEVQRHSGVPALSVRERIAHPEPHGLTLALGVLDNRDRFEFAVEKATELGVTRIIPVTCDHGHHVRSTTERLRQKAIAAITQSGNPWLPSISDPTSFDNLALGEVVIVGDAQGSVPSDLTSHDTWILVGPEGGFSQRELESLAPMQNVVRWRIGSNRLRAETAAVALISHAICM
jgi:16S rRNA (uracil1498-N3)-methyltransferase